MKAITLYTPGCVRFGDGVSRNVVEEVLHRRLKRAAVITSPPIEPLIRPHLQAFREKGVEVYVNSEVDKEPDVATFEKVLDGVRSFEPDAVVAVGGGSALDVGKLVAALHDGSQKVRDVFGIDLLERRNTFLACLPTTSGTGSEVSKNAILLDETDNLKKGVISPHLTPDCAYVDPELTHTVPPSVTAATGMDALTHCIEAYANKNAHPLVDLYALEGIRRIGASLKQACDEPENAEARSELAMGSLLGGFCLGPVNTAAVHALAYPLGGEFHVAHGVSNSVLLPHVLRFNLPAAPQRYADVAVALGAEPVGTPEETAEAGVEILVRLSREIGIPRHLSELGIPREAVPRLAEGALTVRRLLVNNVREVTLEDAVSIYEAAF